MGRLEFRQERRNSGDIALDACRFDPPGGTRPAPSDPMRTVPGVLPAADDLDSARLILRDGTTAIVRPAGPADKALIGAFFHDLSPDARWHRFFSVSEPEAALVDRLIGSGNPHDGLTLIALRSVGPDSRIVAVASYVPLTADAAEA